MTEGPRVRRPAPTGRLAPSPTGRLHLGHARSFLLAQWSVRARGGRLVLRVEDLDAGRSRPELVDTCLRDLAWLGLAWDGAPLFQARDLEPYRAAAERLVAAGRAYACTCSRRDVLALQSAPHAADEAAEAAGGELRYPGTCRGRWADRAAAERATGAPAGLRLRVPAGPVAIEDALLGPRAFDVAAEVGDFLLARRDGVYAYQLAVVVDDARQGVTEVLRGDDLFPSAPRQALLQEALGLPRPRWVHVPLVVDGAGRRLAKRDGSLALASLRAEGVDPRAVVAWAARSAGLDVPERCTADEVTPRFDLARLPREPARLDAATLAALRAARA